MPGSLPAARRLLTALLYLNGVYGLAILGLLLALMIALGCAVALLEHWSLFEGIYFAFVSGLTIGYGDLAPKGTAGRVLAISIGFTGILLGGLIAAVGVQALHATQQPQR